MPARSLSSASFTLQLFLAFAFCLAPSPSSSPPANAGVIVVAAMAPEESKDAAAIRATTTTILWCLLLSIFYSQTVNIITGFIWSAANKYPKIRNNKTKEKEGILNNMISCNMQLTLYDYTKQLTRISNKDIE
jgi:hypothetical protein